MYLVITLVKKTLSQYLELKKEQADIEQRKFVLEATLYAPKTPSLDGMPRGSGGTDTKLNMIAAKKELLELYEQKKEELAKAQINIETLIAELEPSERRLCRLRYIDGLQWETICVEMCYSWRQVHRIHSRALQNLAETPDIIERLKEVQNNATELH
jgi:DNA-directed RNA polymerase specialized sigma24 family protein